MVIIFNLLFFSFFPRPAECAWRVEDIGPSLGCAAMGDLLDGLALQYTAVGDEWFGHELALELEGSFFFFFLPTEILVILCI